MKNRLSNEQIRFFRDSGYLRLNARLTNEQVSGMSIIIKDHIQRKVPPYRVNEAGELRRIDQILDRDPLFLEILRLPEIIEPLEALLGPNIEILKFRHNHATLNLGDDIPFRLHRDIQQWSRPIVSLFIYLEDSSVENGCTHIVPTSQLLPYAGAQSLDGGGNWADEHELYRFVIEQALPIPMPKGGLLLLDSLAFHSVGLNTSCTSRMSVVFAFHSSDVLTKNHTDSTRLLLSGRRCYKGTDVLEISGSLKEGLSERNANDSEVNG